MIQKNKSTRISDFKTIQSGICKAKGQSFPM